jgi:hypothetical protein
MKLLGVTFQGGGGLPDPPLHLEVKCCIPADQENTNTANEILLTTLTVGGGRGGTTDRKHHLIQSSHGLNFTIIDN